MRTRSSEKVLYLCVRSYPPTYTISEFIYRYMYIYYHWLYIVINDIIYYYVYDRRVVVYGYVPTVVTCRRRVSNTRLSSPSFHNNYSDSIPPPYPRLPFDQVSHVYSLYLYYLYCRIYIIYGWYLPLPTNPFSTNTLNTADDSRYIFFNVHIDSTRFLLYIFLLLWYSRYRYHFCTSVDHYT